MVKALVVLAGPLVTSCIDFSANNLPNKLSGNSLME